MNVKLPRNRKVYTICTNMNDILWHRKFNLKSMHWYLNYELCVTAMFLLMDFYHMACCPWFSRTYFDSWVHLQFFFHFFETQCFVACWLFIRSLHHRGHFVGTLKPRLTTLLRKFNALIHLDLRYFWTRSLLVWHQPTSEDKNKYLRFSTNESGNFLIHGFADEKCS